MTIGATFIPKASVSVLKNKSTITIVFFSHLSPRKEQVAQGAGVCVRPTLHPLTSAVGSLSELRAQACSDELYSGYIPILSDTVASSAMPDTTDKQFPAC